MMKLTASFVCGLLFGMGLIISQMVNPQKVTNFLDITGNWDPSLIFVMGSGLLVFALGFFFVVNKRIKKAVKPVFSTQFFIPERKLIDKNLIIGAILFGIGWGLTGICPGPAVANILTFDPKIFAFIGMMLMGMFAARSTLRLKISTETKNLPSAMKVVGSD